MALVNINIGIPEAKLAEVTAMLDDVPMGFQRALSRAINKVGVAARTQVLRMIVKEINVTQKELRDENIRFRRASLDKLFAILEVKGNRIPLVEFGARRTNKGVSYAIRRGQRKTIPSSFLQTMKSGHRGVFLRTGEPRPGRGSKLLSGLSQLSQRQRMKEVWSRMRGPWMVRPRFPISERLGPSVPQVVIDAEEFASGTFERLMVEKLESETDVQVGLILERHGKEANAAPF